MRDVPYSAPVVAPAGPQVGSIVNGMPVLDWATWSPLLVAGVDNGARQAQVAQNTVARAAAPFADGFIFVDVNGEFSTGAYEARKDLGDKNYLSVVYNRQGNVLVATAPPQKYNEGSQFNDILGIAAILAAPLILSSLGAVAADGATATTAVGTAEVSAVPSAIGGTGLSTSIAAAPAALPFVTATEASAIGGSGLIAGLPGAAATGLYVPETLAIGASGGGLSLTTAEVAGFTSIGSSIIAAPLAGTIAGETLATAIGPNTVSSIFSNGSVGEFARTTAATVKDTVGAVAAVSGAVAAVSGTDKTVTLPPVEVSGKAKKSNTWLLVLLSAATAYFGG